MKQLLLISLILITSLHHAVLLADTQPDESTQQTVTETNTTEDKLKAFIEPITNQVKEKIDHQIKIDLQDDNNSNTQHHEAANNHGHRVGIGEAVIAIIAITLSIGSPIILLFLVFFYLHRKRKQKTMLINDFINNGQPVPPELLKDFDGSINDPLYSGLKWTMIGLSIIIAFWIIGAAEAAALGLIPMALGISRLIYRR